MSVDITHMLSSLLELHQEDPSAPGLLLSKLPDGSIYGALQRFTKPFGKEKVVLAKHRAETLEEVLQVLDNYLVLAKETNNGLCNRE